MASQTGRHGSKIIRDSLRNGSPAQEMYKVSFLQLQNDNLPLAQIPLVANCIEIMNIWTPKTFSYSAQTHRHRISFP